MNIAAWLFTAFLAFVGMLAFNAGAKKTTKDPDGSKHRLSFAVFVLVMVLVIGALVIVRADAAQAGSQLDCRNAISGISPEAAGIGDGWVKLKANKWCFVNDNFVNGTSTYPAPSFDRTYGEGVWEFTKWWDTKTEKGTSQAPNGDRGVEYVAQWVAAEFKFCVGVGPAQVCTHQNQGVRIWVWANGNSTIRLSHGKPNLVGGMPKP